MQSRSHLPREYQVLPQAGQEEEQKVFLSSDRVSGTFSESCKQPNPNFHHQFLSTEYQVWTCLCTNYICGYIKPR